MSVTLAINPIDGNNYINAANAAGAGNSAALTLANVDLKGQFSTNAVSIVGSNVSATVDEGASLEDSGDLINTGYNTGDTLMVNGGELQVAGNVVENYGDSETLNGGTITVGAIKETAGLNYASNSYTVTGGTYEVLGSISRGSSGSYDSFAVSGSGQLKVDGSVDLGGDSFSTSGTGSIELASASGMAGGSDSFSVQGQSSIEIGTAGTAGAGNWVAFGGRA
jgi:hypothetical protein